MFTRARLWSPVELDYIKLNIDKPVGQLCIALGRGTGAIKSKIAELKGEKLPVKKSTRSKIGKRKDCNNLFFRSGWEANIYRMFKLDKTVAKIEYEPQDFTFWQFGHHKGTVVYTPDFRVTYKDGSWIWIEVKGGLMKQPDRTKIKRFRKYYPEEFKHLVAITPGLSSKTAQFFTNEGIKILYYYPDLNKKYKKTIDNWE